MFEIKKATCCYCGRRTVLRNTANHGHELACRSCGAPLHVMKALRPERAEAAERHRPAPHPIPVKHKKRKKKKKSLFQRAVSELLDEIEDIFD
ncbi:MAG: hypothetical protein AAF919_04025 [Pseudomonadota bacterium]